MVLIIQQRLLQQEFVQGRISSLIAGAPELLNTLSELSAAIADDEDFAVTITGLVGEKVAKDGDTMTGVLTLSGTPTEPLHAATKGYADNLVSSHNDLTQNIHGISNIGDLATKDYADTAAGTAAVGEVGTHNLLTQNVHGILDTGELATESYVTDAISTHGSYTTNVHGIDDTSALALSSEIEDHTEQTQQTYMEF
jgi:hypothetical protein